VGVGVDECVCVHDVNINVRNMVSVDAGHFRKGYAILYGHTLGQVPNAGQTYVTQGKSRVYIVLHVFAVRDWPLGGQEHTACWPHEHVACSRARAYDVMLDHHVATSCMAD
jgi:hypothetical protein